MKQSQFIDLANRIRLSKTVLYAVTNSHEIGKVKGTLVLCYNEDQQRCLRESRYDELLNAQKLLRQNKTIKAGLEPYFDKKGNLIKKKVVQAEEFDGYGCVFSTKRLSKEKIVRSYFDKDLVEQAFRSLKGVTRLRPIRHWLYNRVRAHIFICYLSYLLLSLLKYRVRKLEISAEEALQELDWMYKVYLKDSKKGFELSRVVALTKKQEAILRAISPRLLKV
jgi:transposase